MDRFVQRRNLEQHSNLSSVAKIMVGSGHSYRHSQSPHRPTHYTPVKLRMKCYSINEYRSSNYAKFGGLGASTVGTEQWLTANDKLLRMRKYGDRFRIDR